jgi:hypothetical protein
MTPTSMTSPTQPSELAGRRKTPDFGADQRSSRPRNQAQRQGVTAEADGDHGRPTAAAR